MKFQDVFKVLFLRIAECVCMNLARSYASIIICYYAVFCLFSTFLGIFNCTSGSWITRSDISMCSVPISTLSTSRSMITSCSNFPAPARVSCLGRPLFFRKYLRQDPGASRSESICFSLLQPRLYLQYRPLKYLSQCGSGPRSSHFSFESVWVEKSRLQIDRS